MNETGYRGFVYASGTSLITCIFNSILPITDTVIAAITFPTNNGFYSGDAAIIGKTLKAGVKYEIWGLDITLTSGTAILYKA